MRKFVSYKAIRISRYKIFFGILGFIIILFVGIKLKLGSFFKIMINEDIKNVLFSNSLGNKSFIENDLYYKSLWGFDILDSKSVFNSKYNLDNFIEEQPIVYIYNTFQTDKFKSNYYNSYNINSVITQVDLILQEYLKLNGINAIVEMQSVSKVLKDNNIAYTNSYKGSRILMEKAKNDNISLKYFVDIQMSDYDRGVTTVNIDGLDYAKLLFVVGTDNVGFSDNQIFANELNEILEQEKKEISRGVSLRGGEGYQGVYNQDFSGNTILIQVGGKENTIDEVNRTMKILAKVIKKYLEDKG